MGAAGHANDVNLLEPKPTQKTYIACRRLAQTPSNYTIIIVIIIAIIIIIVLIILIILINIIIIIIKK